MKQVLVIGSTCVDIIINIDHLPRTEEDIHPTSQTMALGGCAYNVAYMMKLFDAPFTFVSPVGSGFYGEYVEKELREGGFDVCVKVPDQENGCCYCLVEAGGERTFMSYHGAEYTFQKKWMDQFKGKTFDMVYICGLEIEEPTGMELLEYLEEYPQREIFFAPGPRGIRINKEKMDRIYALHPVLHINELEAKELSGCSRIEQAAEKLKEITQNTVIITLGSQGTYCLQKDGESYHLPGFPVDVVDTIGAGDSHIGAILSALSLGHTYREAVTMANKVSSGVVGIKGSSLTKEEFEKVLQSLS